MCMRFAFLGLVISATALAAGVQSASAQWSFYNKRFCTEGGGGERSSGVPDCSFNTWEQCVASARGLGRYCAENPFWRGERQEPTTQGKARRNRER